MPSPLDLESSAERGDLVCLSCGASGNPEDWAETFGPICPECLGPHVVPAEVALGFLELVGVGRGRDEGEGA